MPQAGAVLAEAASAIGEGAAAVGESVGTAVGEGAAAVGEGVAEAAPEIGTAVAEGAGGTGAAFGETAGGALSEAVGGAAPAAAANINVPYAGASANLGIESSVGNISVPYAGTAPDLTAASYPGFWERFSQTMRSGAQDALGQARDAMPKDWNDWREFMKGMKMNQRGRNAGRRYQGAAPAHVIPIGGRESTPRGVMFGPGMKSIIQSIVARQPGLQ